MLPALGISIANKEGATIFGYAVTLILIVVFSFLLMRIKPQTKEFYAKEGFATVFYGWLLMSFFGALPFYVSQEIPSFVDSIFETISGFTTTGSSILTNVEGLSKGLLYWRSFTHWLGGMGVLVFLLAIVPLGKGQGSSLHILRAESPGPSVGKLVPKMRQTAKILYIIYVILTILEFILLMAGGMPVFDSITTAFGTAGTGGFAIKNASIAFYNSAYLDWVITIFMALFGINFNIFYLMLIGQVSHVLKNEELRFYFGIMILSIAVITFNILPLYESLSQALRYSAFQVSSVMTTTGFATADFNTWPELSRSILVLLMILGASAGSTGGGMKVARVLLVVKQGYRGMCQIAYPGSVKVVKTDGKVVDERVLSGVNSYLIVYLIVIVVSVLIISLDNFSFETTLTAVVACINNIGPGLGAVGPLGNFASFSDFSKLILCFDMLLGRLEIFPVLIMFMPSMWRSK